MRIATWNINGVNPRIERLTHWLGSAAPDVLCLQELKCAHDDFPFAAVAAAGYESVVHADGRWNGVGILSRVGLAEVRRNLDEQPAFNGSVEPRALAATAAGIRVWSLYVPNGREVGHAHYDYKLAWLDRVTATAAAEVTGGHADLLLLGDFNVAPTDADVWDPGLFVGATHVTAAERRRLADLADIGLGEIRPRALKYDIPFTFWDYRQLAFPKNNGMRIDLAFGTPAVTAQVRDSYVDREARKGKGSSDHAPLVIDLGNGQAPV